MSAAFTHSLTGSPPLAAHHIYRQPRCPGRAARSSVLPSTIMLGLSLSHQVSTAVTPARIEPFCARLVVSSIPQTIPARRL